ncbi:hypothetical protein NW764_015566 [Fusarium oxysporum]|uniref:Uncharacterized protein n=1 Tax=Fusarium oxysporum f. sp. cepae TaxID=396571 RepID=A0A3L6NPV6_FUSOX|nr:hypothetical protein NW764_015566 [Fusarium oxysporum]RKK20152.1 hypothetical protein BFJ65_g6856 [Fusarium oxysporum f. sp. cepae]
MAVSLAWVPLIAPTWKSPYSRTTGGWRRSFLKWTHSCCRVTPPSTVTVSPPLIDGEDASPILHRDDDAGTHYEISGRMHGTDGDDSLVLVKGSSGDGLNVPNLHRPLEAVIGYFEPNFIIPVGE